ncbi:DNA polymerase III subunit delta [Chloroflexota bacterium]
MLYILHGEDDFSSREAYKQIKAGLGDGDMLSCNTTVLDGQDVKMSALIGACITVPFMTSCRLVMVKGLLARLQGEGKAKGKSKSDGDNWQTVADYIKEMPPSNVLVLLDGQIRKDGAVFKKLKDLAEVREFPLIKGGQLISWIGDRAQQCGASITRSAAAQLADYIGSNLWVLANEIEKLSLYRQGEQITDADVTEMVSYITESNVFAVIDALINRQRSPVVRLLHRLLGDGVAPAYLLFMITRQYRLMVQANDMSTAKVPSAEIGGKLGIRSDWALRKLLDQSLRYTMARLEADYRRILDTDIRIKTGRYNAELALDMLIMELCQPS